MVSLSLSDRFNLLANIPKTGNFEELILRSDLIKKIELSQDEITRFEVQTTDAGYGKSQISWKDPDNTIFEINLTSAETNEIKKVFQKMSTEGSLEISQLELYKKFL